MKDQALIHELASCPPNVWAHRLHQASIIDPLLSEGATSKDVGNACAQLGVTRRRIRQLMEYARQRKLGSDPRGNSRGFGLWLGNEQEAVIEEALDYASEHACLKAVCDLVAECSRKREVRLPSTATIRHRFNENRSRRGSFAPLHLDYDTTLDLVPLQLSVIEASGATGTGWLLVQFDSQTTHVRGFEVFSGRPTPPVLSRRIQSFNRHDRGSACYGATNTIIRILKGAPDQLGKQIKSASLSRSLTAGAVARAAFGLRIGKIKLLADTRALREVEIAPVTRQVARDVIGYLLNRNGIKHQFVSDLNISLDALAS